MTDTHPTGTDVWDDFHPAVSTWFHETFASATPAQQRAWPAIHRGRSTLIAAPTGSGKTLTAFLAAIDGLVRESLAHGGTLPDATTIVYVSPLKALSNDIRLNLDAPLEGIGDALARMGLPAHGIRTAVRTGDSTAHERQAMRKRAPHILVTTPESLYVLLGSDSGRAMLSTTRTVIVDEIHAIAGVKRGSHLALSLERLDALCARRPTRIGLSATQKPLDAVARFLVGETEHGDCEIVDVGHTRARDLALEMPPVPLDAVMSNDAWERVYDRIAELAIAHRTTLVFVNTRRMAERAARHLADRLGADAVAAHHGSLAKEHRFDAEQRLKRGELRVLIATASLELGIDIGEIDLVCQVGSPRSIAAFLQRVGRAGHQVGGTSKGRLFPNSRDDLVECAALLDCIRRGELDTLRVPHAPLDVLAQQIVAEVALREWSEDALYDRYRRASPYADLPRERYDAIVEMLAQGYTTRHGVRGAYIHRDTVSRTLRARRGGKLTAVTSGGTIPDNADYAVVLEPQGQTIGTVNEDFAVESLAGDVFQLGNTSYRILRIESGRVRVEDAHGAAPNIPFWLGEAPGRSDALSAGVARLRATIDTLLDARTGSASDPIGAALAWLTDTVGLDAPAARQIVDYLARSRAALGHLPTQDTLVLERFFDESGGMQLVLHAPFGSRVNRAWGLTLRKRFCRTFNFELQAAATEDALILSLTAGHSFVLDEVWKYLHSNSAEHLLIQALLDAPLFNVRWRWTSTTSLALPRYVGGRKVPPQWMRMRSDDLLASVFPDQAACLENVVGEREIPSHPLVDQTLDDCLHEAMDTDAWLAILRRIEAADVRLVARDLPAPSPLAMEILSARPYAYLDDAPIEERRTQAVLSRRWSDPESSDDLSALDAAAIERVREEAWPDVSSADEMHEALMSLACVSGGEASVEPSWSAWLATLAAQGRAVQRAAGSAGVLWVPVERLDTWRAVYGDGDRDGDGHDHGHGHGHDDNDRDHALVEIVRSRMTGFGPLTVDQIAAPLGLPVSAISMALMQLEREGYVLRGRFEPGAQHEQWCERHLLARIHRYTIRTLRREIEPVERQDFMRFLLDWQHVSPSTRRRGSDALPDVLAQLEGYEAAASAWESDLLPARIGDYAPPWLDTLCRAGKMVWTRFEEPAHASTGGPVRSTPIVLIERRHLPIWSALPHLDAAPAMSARAERAHAALAREGAMFFDELLAQTRLLPTELEQALGELVSMGLVNADGFAGLRALLLPASKRAMHARRRSGRGMPVGMDDAGRWALIRRPRAPLDDTPSAGMPADASARPTSSSSPCASPSPSTTLQTSATAPRPRSTAASTSRSRPARGAPIDPATLDHIARVLLRRYGVVFWRLLEREAAWLPPWRDMLRVFHRLEARGEIRGGRFVAGIAGEQFALPEAIPVLREVRRRAHDHSCTAISGVDPLNLCGTLLPGDKVPAIAGNRIVLRDGLPVATSIAGKTHWLVDVTPIERDAIREALVIRS
ncbi:DEAD/DEAH box helicase [Pararobbsia silviterrae]|uniref:DEAD/DEAH box helicase n=1 Tax=Pararobbsia silviterrae TaxID=1792498 RepID=A0A494XWF3_9BURK|nr:DEAD/DEAH box helicase [Pararobbsia silviterrae]RKP54888.1 DEAD/DEAH box helicase [Pararobbsia silviterrae]